jgi:hypothetical protein
LSRHKGQQFLVRSFPANRLRPVVLAKNPPRRPHADAASSTSGCWLEGSRIECEKAQRDLAPAPSSASTCPPDGRAIPQGTLRSKAGEPDDVRTDPIDHRPRPERVAGEAEEVEERISVNDASTGVAEARPGARNGNAALTRRPRATDAALRRHRRRTRAATKRR